MRFSQLPDTTDPDVVLSGSLTSGRDYSSSNKPPPPPVTGNEPTGPTQRALKELLASMGLEDKGTYNWDDIAALGLVRDRAGWEKAHPGMSWQLYVANLQIRLKNVEDAGLGSDKMADRSAAKRAYLINLLLNRAVENAQKEDEDSARKKLEAAARAQAEAEKKKAEAASGGGNSILDKVLGVVDSVLGTNTDKALNDHLNGDKPIIGDKDTNEKYGFVQTAAEFANKYGLSVPDDKKSNDTSQKSTPQDGDLTDAKAKKSDLQADIATRSALALLPLWSVPYGVSWTGVVLGSFAATIGASMENRIVSLAGTVAGAAGEFLVVARACTESAIGDRTPHAVSLGLGGLVAGGAGYITGSPTLMFLGLGGVVGAAVIQVHWLYLETAGIVNQLEKCVSNPVECSKELTATYKPMGWLSSIFSGLAPGSGVKRKSGTETTDSHRDPQAPPPPKRKRQAPQRPYR